MAELWVPEEPPRRSYEELGADYPYIFIAHQQEPWWGDSYVYFHFTRDVWETMCHTPDGGNMGHMISRQFVKQPSD